MTAVVPAGRGLGDADGSGATGVGRLVLISTAHLRWPLEERSVLRHAALLGSLLDTSRPGGGWFTCSDSATRREASGSRASSDDRDPWRWSAAGGNRLDSFVVDLRKACVAGRRNPDAGALAGLRHRVFVDAERFRAVAGRHVSAFPGLAFSVVFDFRFSSLGDTSVCHVNVSVWSDTPWSAHHRPDDVAGPGPMPAEDLLSDAVERAFLAVRADAAEFIEPRFTVANLRVFGRPYRAPVFWTVIARSQVEDPRDFLDASGRLLLRDTGRRLLGVSDARDRGLAQSVVDGDMLVLRRFAPRRRSQAGRPHLPRPARQCPRSVR